jgi:cellobiose phosphorylase
VKPVIAEYLSSANVKAAFGKLLQHWDGLAAICQAEMPGFHTNRMVNVWNAYQFMATFNISLTASLASTG